MGLFGRRSAAQETAWRPDGIGGDGNGDAVGGDYQRGDSYGVRFVRDDMPGSLIDVTFYAVEYDENPGEFRVQRCVEWRVCEDPEDPGGTEVWSDAIYDDPMDTTFDSAGAAEDNARETAEDALERADAYGTWDGEPFESGA